MALRLQARVTVDTVKADSVLQELEKALAQLLRAWRPEPDGIGDALPDGLPIVRPARRQVEQVACFHEPFPRRPEAAEDPQGRSLDQGQIPLAAYAPAPRTLALQQKNI